MKFYLAIQGEEVIVQTRMEGGDDYHQTIHPGEDFNGILYEQLQVHAEKDGWIEIILPSGVDMSH